MNERNSEATKAQATFQEEFPHGSASAMECMLNIVRTGQLAVAQLTQFLKPYGLTPFAFNALAIIAGASEPVSPHVVSDRMLVPRNTLTGILDSLERGDLIQRRPHPTNRKMVVIEATPQGRRFIHDLLVHLHTLEAEWFSWMAEPDRQTLIALLQQVQAHFSSGPRIGRRPRSTAPERSAE